MRGYRQPRPHDYVGKCMNSSAVSRQRVVGSSLEGACLNQGMQVKKKIKPNKTQLCPGPGFCLFHEPVGWWSVFYAKRGKTTL